MSATTDRGYPYPQSTDSFDPAADIQALAEAVDADLTDAQGTPLVRLVQATGQPLSNNTAAALTFTAGSVVVDTHSFHSTTANTTRITPSVPGWYRLVGTVSMVSASYTQVLAVIRKNGSNISPLILTRPDAAGGAAAEAVQVTALEQANGSTDYFEVVGQQNSSGSQNTNVVGGLASTFECQFIRPLVS
jgi:hypothetical protein